MVERHARDLEFEVQIPVQIRSFLLKAKTFLRRNCLLHDTIEGQMMEVKGVGRKRTQLLDDLRNRRCYWELKEEAED